MIRAQHEMELSDDEVRMEVPINRELRIFDQNLNIPQKWHTGGTQEWTKKVLVKVTFSDEVNVENKCTNCSPMRYNTLWIQKKRNLTFPIEFTYFVDKGEI